MISTGVLSSCLASSLKKTGPFTGLMVEVVGPAGRAKSLAWSIQDWPAVGPTVRFTRDNSFVSSVAFQSDVEKLRSRLWHFSRSLLRYLNSLTTIRLLQSLAKINCVTSPDFRTSAISPPSPDTPQPTMTKRADTQRLRIVCSSKYSSPIEE